MKIMSSFTRMSLKQRAEMLKMKRERKEKYFISKSSKKRKIMVYKIL
jgi:hypothetical protein